MYRAPKGRRELYEGIVSLGRSLSEVQRVRTGLQSNRNGRDPYHCRENTHGVYIPPIT